MNSTERQARLSRHAPLIIRFYKGKPLIREGRGFSKMELNEARLGIELARKLRVLVDLKRKSTYEPNLATLRDILLRSKVKSTPVAVAAETG